MTMPSGEPRTFTGRHMLAAILAFFGVITAVNLTMAAIAMNSWTGLIVRNSYVASQEFNENAEAGRAQAALGWQGELAYAKGELRYQLRRDDGTAVLVGHIEVELGRPAHEAEDRTLDLPPADGEAFAARIALADGQWVVRVSAEAEGLTAPWLDIRRIHVRNGTAQ